LWLLERIFGGRKTNADGGVAMKTPEDEAFEDIERRQGGGFLAKRVMAADKLLEPVECLDCGSNNVGIPATYDSLVDSVKSQPVQEPVAWITPDGEGFRIRFSTPTNEVPLGWDALYTTPPKREWVGLTLDEIEELFQSAAGADEETDIRFARLIESKLKEKNT
jgi:hypothetical protein